MAKKSEKKKTRYKRSVESLYDEYLEELKDRRKLADSYAKKGDMESAEKIRQRLEPMSMRDFQMEVQYQRDKYKVSGKYGHIARDVVTSQVYDYSRAQYKAYTTAAGDSAHSETQYRLFGDEDLENALSTANERYKTNLEEDKSLREQAIRSLEVAGKKVSEGAIRAKMISIQFFRSP